MSPGPFPFGFRWEYAGGLVTDLLEIRRLGEMKRAENLHFRRFLASHHVPSSPLRILASRIQDQTDCTTCANCCRYSTVPVTAAEIAAIAARLGVTAEQAEQRYTEPDPESHNGRLLRSTPGGCVFLKGNLCSIYEVRPGVCRGFPHILPDDHSLGSRLSSLCRWAALCPIIYNALEDYKHVVGYHPRAAQH